jgi:hypothetical protein
MVGANHELMDRIPGKKAKEEADEAGGAAEGTAAGEVLLELAGKVGVAGKGKKTGIEYY